MNIKRVFLALIAIVVLAFAASRLVQPNQSIELSDIPDQRRLQDAPITGRELSYIEQPNIEEYIARQAEMDLALTQIKATMIAISRGDQYATWLAEMFNERAVAAVIDPRTGVTMTLSAEPPDPNRPIVQIVMMTTAEARRYGRIHSTFSFARGDFQFVYDQPWSPDFLAIVALHEAVHWDDLYLSGENGGTPRETNPHDIRQAFEGEVRAHVLEDKLMGMATNGVYRMAVNQIVEDPDLHEVRDSYKIPNQLGVNYLAQVWGRPPQSPSEAALLTAAFYTSVVFAQCESEEERYQAYTWMRRRLAAQ